MKLVLIAGCIGFILSVYTQKWERELVSEAMNYSPQYPACAIKTLKATDVPNGAIIQYRYGEWYYVCLEENGCRCENR